MLLISQLRFETRDCLHFSPSLLFSPLRLWQLRGLAGFGFGIRLQLQFALESRCLGQLGQHLGNWYINCGSHCAHCVCSELRCLGLCLCLCALAEFMSICKFTLYVAARFAQEIYLVLVIPCKSCTEIGVYSLWSL